jgi:hypothetical protein
VGAMKPCPPCSTKIEMSGFHQIEMSDFFHAF